MREVTIQVFKFSELSDDAKQRARDWYRRGWEFSDEFVLEYAIEMGAKLGITFQAKDVEYSVGGGQSDGACFTGSYSYAKGAAKALAKDGPKDGALDAIAAMLVDVQKANGYKLTCNVRRLAVSNLERSDAKDLSEGSDLAMTLALKAFANWIFRQLQEEYDYQQADEQIDETIEANEYEFEASGKFHC